MNEILLVAAVLVICAAIVVIVHLARIGQLGRRMSMALAAGCGLGLLAMLVTDWPTNLLADFWAGHSVLAAVLSSVLLVGLAFLVWELEDQRKQERMSHGLTGAGLGGMVDHAVDLEVALALLSATEPPSRPAWQSWRAPGKPLRWLREDREILNRKDDGLGAEDPRRCEPILPEAARHAWRIDLIDQGVRRLLAGMRDWTPLIGQSRDGITALLVLSAVRQDLMMLSSLIEEGQTARAEAVLGALRARLRQLAHYFEHASGARAPRPELCFTSSGLTSVPERATDDLNSDAWLDLTATRSWRQAMYRGQEADETMGWG